jgi:ferredoxin-NADP reductase
MSSYQTVLITSIREETPGVKTFTLSNEDGSAIPYVAGQFITLVFTHHGKEERRSYSISTSPAVNEPLSFTVKRVDNGAYSRLLTDRAAVGDKLQTTGAAGLFTLPENIETYDQVFFFVAGIGITPVISLIKTLLHTQPSKQVVLIYSNRSREDVVFYNELNVLSEAYPDNFKVDFLYSTSFDLARARLSKTLVPVLLKEYAMVSKEKMLFYICGPFTYMRMVLLSLEEQGIHSDHVKKENFNTNDRDIRRAEPADKGPHIVSLRMNDNTYSFTAHYPDTILQAAKKNGISLPYSCEVGRCGSCAAICSQGKVWLSYNEVLMDADLKKGMILTCVGHPVDGDVTIEI